MRTPGLRASVTVGFALGALALSTVLAVGTYLAARQLLGLDGQAVRSCLMLAIQSNGQTLTTVEGLAAEQDNLHPLQQAFWEAHGLQCGFCTPGFLMTLVPFLQENPQPTEAEIREAISGNLCRCTGYQHIVDAVKLAAEKNAEQGA